MLSIIAVAVIISGLFIAVLFSVARGADEVRAKAAKRDEICSYSRYAVRADRKLLKEEKSRDTMLATFNGAALGDGAQMLEWCMTKPFDTTKFVECRARADYTCLDQLLRETEEDIASQLN